MYTVKFIPPDPDVRVMHAECRLLAYVEIEFSMSDPALGGLKLCGLDLWGMPSGNLYVSITAIGALCPHDMSAREQQAARLSRAYDCATLMRFDGLQKFIIDAYASFEGARKASLLAEGENG